MSPFVEIYAPIAAVAGAVVLIGRVVRQRLARRGRIVLWVAIGSLCIWAGVAQALQTASDVSPARTVLAAVIAAAGLVALPFGLFFSIGYRLRSAAAALVAWAVGSALIVSYLLIVGMVLDGLSGIPYDV